MLPPYMREKPFLSSPEWEHLRFKALEKYGDICMCCGSTKHINVDHIKSRSEYPELSLEFDNLQILCAGCNLRKGWEDETDYRPINNPSSSF